MPPVTDNLAARIGALVLSAFVIVALCVALLMMWPRPGDTASGLFQLPLPDETAAIVAAIEASPPMARPLVLRALNTSVVSVHLAPSFPPVPPGLVRSERLENLFTRYGEQLQGRSFRVDIRRAVLTSFLSLQGRSRASVQMSIMLRDGSVVVIQRRPPELVRSYIGRSAVAVAAIATLLLAALALAVRQTVRPVNRLALAARAFSLDGTTPDLAVEGPRELRALATAFNDMQRRIRGLVEERTRLLAAVAHDLRTYLTRLRLRMEFVDDADQRRRGERDVAEMSELLDDILLFAERSQQPAQAAGLDVRIDLSAEVAAFVAVRRELGEPVSAQTPPAGAPLSIGCPPLLLRRMLNNLVDNALTYGDVARVCAVAGDHGVELRVDDDGPGIPEADLARVLQPFERLDASRARSTGGAGLGLAIVSALTAGCGARLRLENRPGGGLRASVLFPPMTQSF